MNKLAYDLALICAKEGAERFNPASCTKYAEILLESFEKSYNHLIQLGHPFLESFDSSNVDKTLE